MLKVNIGGIKRFRDFVGESGQFAFAQQR